MRKIVLFLISFYQTTIALLIGGSCRFYPSCSNYAKMAIQEKGVTRGVWVSLKRILRCHPLSSGGYDPVN